MVAQGSGNEGLYSVHCRLCQFSVKAHMFDGVRAGMTMKEAQDDVMGRMIRAQNEFFRDHWLRKHPEEAAEIMEHIAAVTRLARVTSYQRRVLYGRFEGLAEQPTDQPAA
jgi:hypothetical protein